MAIERIYKQPASNPKLFDKTIQNLQDALGGLSWLNHVFGRCERLAKVVNGQRLYSPNVYRGRDEYILLTPDNTDLGNYCFFVCYYRVNIGVYTLFGKRDFFQEYINTICPLSFRYFHRTIDEVFDLIGVRINVYDNSIDRISEVVINE